VLTTIRAGFRRDPPAGEGSEEVWIGASAGGQDAPDLGEEMLVVDRLAQDGANSFVFDPRYIVGVR
jgi:hypothetical protein